MYQKCIPVMFPIAFMPQLRESFVTRWYIRTQSVLLKTNSLHQLSINGQSVSVFRMKYYHYLYVSIFKNSMEEYGDIRRLSTLLKTNNLHQWSNNRHDVFISKMK